VTLERRARPATKTETIFLMFKELEEKWGTVQIDETKRGWKMSRAELIS
jgi:hypothetical protein